MLLDYYNGVSISRVLSTSNDHLMFVMREKMW
jgi:hypothetical protein